MLNKANHQNRIQNKAHRWQATPEIHRLLVAFSVALLCFTAETRAQTSAFTFQGQLKDNGALATGSYDIQLKLYDTVAAGTGTQIGPTVNLSAVPVKNGVFTAQPDFGANAFPGADRFLEVGVKPAGSNTAFTILDPRQPITPTPYAIRSSSAVTADSALSANNATNAGSATNASHATNSDHATNADNATNATNASHATNSANADNATTATNATQLGGLPPSNYVQTSDARLSDARPPTAGSTNYIQTNATATAQAGDFNILGNGFVGGSIGIGTTAPLSKLAVVGQDAVRLYGYQPFLTLYDSNAGDAAGRIQAAGGDLNLFTQSYLDGSNASSFLKLANSGNVGIGTATPNTKLTLIGGPVWTSNGWRTSMNLQNAAALGWEANASGQRFGIGQSTGGLFFFRTNSAFGNTASPANYDMVITDAGDVTQPRDRGGLVKAMAYIDPTLPAAQYVVRGFNSQVVGNAGSIKMTRSGVGDYKVNVGFDVRDRFISATCSAAGTNTSPTITASPYGNSDPNSILVLTFDVNFGNYVDNPFYIFIY